jgi:hypothetical protein
MLSYYRQLWRTAITDFQSFWNAHRIVTSVPAPIIGFLVSLILSRGIHTLANFWTALETAAISALAALSLTLSVSLFRAPKLLDDKRSSEIRELTTANQAFLQERNRARDHRYTAAKTALAQLDPKALIVLRHLANHGSLTFRGNFNPPLPPKIDASTTHSLLNLCLVKDLVTCHKTYTSTGALYPAIDEIYQIAPGMKAALDELLYAPPTELLL